MTTVPLHKQHRDPVLAELTRLRSLVNGLRVDPVSGQARRARLALQLADISDAFDQLTVSPDLIAAQQRLVGNRAIAFGSNQDYKTYYNLLSCYLRPDRAAKDELQRACTSLESTTRVSKVHARALKNMSPRRRAKFVSHDPLALSECLHHLLSRKPWSKGVVPLGRRPRKKFIRRLNAYIDIFIFALAQCGPANPAGHSYHSSEFLHGQIYASTLAMTPLGRRAWGGAW